MSDRWQHRQLVSSQNLWWYHVLSASTVNFEMIFDAFVWPVKFVASVRNSPSSQNGLISSQINREKIIVQPVDPRSLLMKQTHNLLTLDHSYWNKIVISWPSIDHNWANSEFRQRRLLRYPQMTARIDLVNWEFHLISSYRYPWMIRCVSTDDLRSLSYITLGPYHIQARSKNLTILP